MGPFGRKVQQIPQIDLKAKEEETEKEKEREEKDEDFLNQRQDAINAAVNTSGTIKIVKGSGRQIELQQTERRGRGRGGGRNRDREDYSASSRPRDSIRLFEFLEPQIGVEEEQPVEENTYEDCYAESVDTYQERSESYGRREGSHNEQSEFHRGRGVSSRGNRGSYQDREESYSSRGGSSRGRGGSYQDREESYSSRDGFSRGRGGSYQEREESYSSRGRSSGGRGGSYEDREESYRGRGRSSRGRGGSSRGRGGSYQDRDDSYRENRSNRGNYHGRGGYNQTDLVSFPNHTVDNLVDDFNVWPGLEPTPSRPAPKVEPLPSNSQEQWVVEDYCLAKWELTNQHYPAIIQQLVPSRKSATVLFIEPGAIRIVEMKNLRRDPQDTHVAESAQGGRSNNRPRGSLVYSSRNH